MINYPSDRLLYWQNIYSPLLHHSVKTYFSGSPFRDDQELGSVKSYVKHWIEFDGHQFEDESDREFLLTELEKCKNVESLNLVIRRLLGFGIDPF